MQACKPNWHAGNKLYVLPAEKNPIWGKMWEIAGFVLDFALNFRGACSLTKEEQFG
jgi:hypothetical protein